MTARLTWQHVLAAALILLMIVGAAMHWSRSREWRNACEHECTDQGLDQWLYDSQTNECRCFALDPV